jgi:hypothetical protein
MRIPHFRWQSKGREYRYPRPGCLARDAVVCYLSPAKQLCVEEIDASVMLWRVAIVYALAVITNYRYVHSATPAQSSSSSAIACSRLMPSASATRRATAKLSLSIYLVSIRFPYRLPDSLAYGSILQATRPLVKPISITIL